jgi:superfamily II DNA or RNA helicase
MPDVTPLFAQTLVSPRPYQQRIVGKAIDLFCTEGMRSLLVESPTGSGKTVMALLIARALQDRLGVRVGWVAMRRNLLAQAEAENRARGIGARCEYVSMFEKDPPRGLDLLVVDEAQHDAANSMAHLHQLIQPRYILGLTATPFRSDRVKLCFDRVLRDAGIHPLIQDGYLSKFHHYTLAEYRPDAVADCYLRDRPRWGKSIVYFHTLTQCAEADRLLRAHGVRSEVVTASSDRDAQIEAFRAGRLDVLLNCVVLCEGFDCPELKTVFCRPSCKGVTIQMCGRVLRKHPELPYKQVVQCRKSPWPFLRTATAEQTFTCVDGEWRGLELNPQINAISGRTLQALAKITVELPKYVLARQDRRTNDSRWHRSARERF